MFNDFLRSKFEITVQKTNNLFQASCPMFPESIGIGETEKAAVEDLADLIAYRMGGAIKRSLNNVINTGMIKRKKTLKFTKKELPPTAKVTKKVVTKKATTFDGMIPYPPISKMGMVVMGFSPKKGMFEQNDVVDIFDHMSERSEFGDRGASVGVDDGVFLGVPVSFN